MIYSNYTVMMSEKRLNNDTKVYMLVTSERGSRRCGRPVYCRIHALSLLVGNMKLEGG